MLPETGTHKDFKRAVLLLSAPEWVCPNHAVEFGCTPILPERGYCQHCERELEPRYGLRQPAFQTFQLL